MANAKVNTEELIVRNPTDTPANADANSLRVYTDGTDLYIKDSSGNVTSISSAPVPSGAAGTVQLSDGSGGLSSSDWGASSHLVPLNNSSQDLGAEGSAVRKAYIGSSGLFLSSVASPSLESDYSTLKVDSSTNKMLFETPVSSGVATYELVTGTGDGSAISLQGNGQVFSWETKGSLSDTQRILLPDTAPSVNQVLKVSSLGAGNKYQTTWESLTKQNHFAGIADLFYIRMGSQFSNSGEISTPDLVRLSPLIMQANSTWTSGGLYSQGVEYKTRVCNKSLSNSLSVTPEGDLAIVFQLNQTATTDFNSTTANVTFKMTAISTTGEVSEVLIDQLFTSKSVVVSGTRRTITIPLSEIESNFSGDVSYIDTVSHFEVEVYVWNLSTTIEMSSSSTLRLLNLSFPFSVDLN